MRVPVSAPLAAKPVGPYSPGILAGEWLFLSGQVGFEPSTGLLVDGGITAQTEQVMRNIGVLLDAAGASFANVVRTTVFLADMNDFAAMNAVYSRHVVDPPPARSTVQVAALPRQALVEIDVIAVLD
jgi:2-iminobutanoate/2-iminopropanoate deaminase